MEKFEYIVVSVNFSIWTGKAKEDYLEIINDYGQNGWRFIDFAPSHARVKRSQQMIELIFERKLKE